MLPRLQPHDLGMAGAAPSPAALRMVGVAAARTSFHGSGNLLRELAGLRMDCPKFRAMGLCVATGVVEGGCKSIVGTRLKQGGMH